MIGDLTYKRVMNATKYEIERLLKEHGYTEYYDCSRLYIANKMKERAKLRGKDYYI